MKGTVLITGSTGFIGQKLLSDLLQQGLNVHCLVRNPKTLNNNNDPRMKIIQGDITDKKSLTNLNQAYDYIYHLAGHLSGGTERVFKLINIQGTRNLYETIDCFDYKPKRIIHVSSMAAAGPSTELIAKTEKQEAKPISIYGRTKLAGEKVAIEFMDKLPITIIRPSVVYGPNDKNALSIYKMIDNNFILTPPKQPKYYSMVHVDDLVKIIQKLSTEKKAIGEVLNIACGNPCSWDDLIKLISDSMDRKPKSFAGNMFLFSVVAFMNHFKSIILRSKADILTPQKLPELYAQYWTVDTKKLESTLDKIDNIDLKNGIQETAEWYKVKGWI